ncbi:Cysteine proteinase inhibitor 2 [Striga hermonthica]|uniref:Cysteine proteinase inhibitor 2 n=1 Tax=Striga hermonthica TaxID=68872 RepID=A0A9N7NNH1_STRHE|nr:Cysteine proteinase inhibitor 2 [Striga hermonthica]
MADRRKSTILFLFLILLILPLLASALGRKVGGRRPVENVEANKEVQNLGRYCVRQYNHQQQAKGNGSASRLLVFSRVVEAETQVVSGIKYYLKISAAPAHGRTLTQTFEAVVVVRPWLGSKQLLGFKPLSHTKSTK